MNYREQIVERIENLSWGDVFIANDFFEIAGYETVRSTLNRLTNEGMIARVMRGIYYKPRYLAAIDEYEAPSAEKVAQALARKYNWTIAPSGNTALNALGLSTQVPAKWTYISDGRYADFHYGNTTIAFQRRNNGDISGYSPMSATVVQAIKTIGKGHVTQEQIELLRKKLSDEDKARLLEEAKTTGAWVYRIVRSVCEVA